MNQTILLISCMVILIIIIIIILIKQRQINDWFLKYYSGPIVSPYIPLDKEFNQLLTDIKHLNYESKCQILRSCMSGSISIHSETTKNGIIIKGCFVSDVSTEEQNKLNNMIG